MTGPLSDLATTFEELIAALDRRLPRIEQAGEAAIARDAAALRAKAIDRLAELTREQSVAATDADRRDTAERDLPDSTQRRDSSKHP